MSAGTTPIALDTPCFDCARTPTYAPWAVALCAPCIVRALKATRVDLAEMGCVDRVFEESWRAYEATYRALAKDAG